MANFYANFPPELTFHMAVVLCYWSAFHSPADMRKCSEIGERLCTDEPEKFSRSNYFGFQLPHVGGVRDFPTPIDELSCASNVELHKFLHRKAVAATSGVRD